VPRRRRDYDGGSAGGPTGPAQLETAFCAEVVAASYHAMRLLPDELARRSPSWYDPGRFWSGDGLPLLGGAWLGDEIAVEVPPL